MIKVENHLGDIRIAGSYLTSLIGHAASRCFGVVRMSPIGAKQGLRTNILKGSPSDRGVKVYSEKGTGKIVIELHIYVTYGVNVAAIVDSIINKVRYVVESETGLSVHRVNVFVDGLES